MANSGGWYVFLFLFILGCACQGINQIGIWNVAEPNMNYQVTLDQLNQTHTAAATSSPLNIFVVYDWIVKFMLVIGSGLLACASIGALFFGMGWTQDPVSIALIQMIQSPANVILLFWLFELWTGR